MKKETRNNGIVDYEVYIADSDKMLIEKSSMKVIGKEIALGYDYYDRKTGELLKTPKKAKSDNLIEAWDYDNISKDQQVKDGEYIFYQGELYVILSKHYIREDTEDNFNTFYQKMT